MQIMQIMQTARGDRGLDGEQCRAAARTIRPDKKAPEPAFQGAVVGQPGLEPGTKRL